MNANVKQILIKTLIGFGLVAIGFFGWSSLKLWIAWQSVDTVAFDIAASREIIVEQRSSPTASSTTLPDDLTGEDPATVPSAPVSAPDPVQTGTFRSFLIVGSDARPELGGARADVIMLFLLPEDGSNPSLVSIPRDLYLPSPCNDRVTRINANLNGCGGVSGPELLALAVEDFTGVSVDHFALFDFEGFKKVIDRVGGVTICVENSVRDGELNLPAGCSEVGGTQALAWVRSRKTRELVGGTWRLMPGVNDLTRNERQQDIIFQMFEKMKEFSSVGSLTKTVQGLADAFTLDDGLSLGRAIDLAWSLRGMDSTSVERLRIPVKGHTTDAGAQVLLPTKPFAEILAEVYPGIQITRSALEAGA